jgi:hypothetical protein
VDTLVARLNIEHYRNLLDHESDSGKRQMLQKLLAEEEKKLLAAEADHNKKKHGD